MNCFSKYIYIFFFSLLAIYEVNAQVKKADRLYNFGNYASAVQLYEKEIKKGRDFQIEEKLASCYRLLHDYNKAVLWYAEIVKSKKSDPINNFYYAQILQTLGDFKKAKEQYLAFAKKQPNDKRGLIFASYCDSIMNDISLVNEFVIKNVEKINSSYSEFGSYYYKNELIFISNKENNYLEEKTNKLTGQLLFKNLKINYNIDSLLNISVGEFSIFNEFSESGSHYGPGYYSPSDSILYFTKSVSHKTKQDIGPGTFYLGIYSSEKINDKWTTPKLMSINQEGYSTACPSLSADGNYLFFSSNRPGGFGGTDIYYSEKDIVGEWSLPINLGDKINTIGNEKFPFIHQDGSLYFASDGHPGIGGLDVYIAKNIQQEWNVCHLQAPFNSPGDDFALIIDDKKMSGFISSNRQGGKGDDDIYYFSKNLNIECKSIHNDYCVLLEAEEEQNIDVIYEWILGIEDNKEGRQIRHCYPGPGTYYAQLIVKNKATKEILFQDKQIKIIIEDDDSTSFGITIESESPLELNRLIKFDASGLIQDCDIKKYIWDMGDGNILFGKTIQYQYKEVGEYKVSLKLLGEGMGCNKNCNECVYKLISVTDDNKEINIEAVDTSIWIKGIIRTKVDSQPVFGLMLVLESEKNIDFTVSDQNGFFYFIIEKNQNYNLSFTSDDFFNIKQEISSHDIDKGKIIKNDLYVERIELNKSIKIDNVYYSSGGYELNKDAIKALDDIVSLLIANPNIRMEISSHTDSRSDAKHNLELSQKRANKVISYMISKGVSPSKIIGKGYGEENLINHCKDGVNCSEEEHKLNRRTEFKVIDIQNF